MSYVNRKQVNLQLKKMLQQPFIYAYGVEESGKSTAIRHFLKNEKQLNYQWFKVLENQDPSVLWGKVFEKIKGRCSLDESLRSYPRGDVDLKRYAGEFKKKIKTPFVLVFEGGNEDDIYRLLEMYWILSSRGKGMVKIIFINTRPPGKKFITLVQKGYCSILKQRSFLFQADEIDKFYSQLRQEHNREDIKQCLKVSGGWVAMMKRVEIKQMPNVPIVAITDLMEQILKDYFSSKQLTSLLKICFLDKFELDQVYYLTKDKGLTIKIIALADGNLIFQESEGIDTYQLLPPFRKLLMQKLNASRINKEVLNQNQLHWLILKHKYLEALEFAYKTDNLECILAILMKYPNPMYYDLKPKLMEGIYEKIPQEELMKHLYAYMQVMEDYLLMINPQKGYEMLKDLEAYLDKEEFIENRDLVEGELELIKGYVAFNDLYEMSKHFKRAYHHIYPKVSKLSTPDMVISFGSPHALYLYLTDPGNCRQLISHISREIEFYSDITQGLNVSLELQSEAEYGLETGNYTQAILLAEKAYHKAFMYNIRYMCISSLFTIGRASILTHDEYNYEKAIYLMQEEKENSINIFLKKEIESAMAYLLSLKPLDDGELEDVLNPNIETELIDAAHHSFSYIAQGQIFINRKDYRKLFTLSQKMHMFYSSAKHVFGDIYSELYESIALFYLGKEKDALKHMQAALSYCAKDHFTTPLVEQGELVSDILKKMKQTKQIALIEKEIQAYTKYKIFHFTEKEVQVFNLQKKGYSRNAIAEEMDTTLYAVKYYLQNIKKKTSNRRVSVLFEDKN